MKLKRYIMIAAALFAGVCAKAETAAQLRQRLADAVANGQTYFGHHDDPVYGHDWAFGETGRSDVLETAGKYPGMMSWDLGDIEWGRDKNLDGVNFDRMRREVADQHRRGGINTFSWHCDHPITGADSWQTADTTLVSVLVNTEAGRKAYAAQLDRLCDFFDSLVDDNGEKIPVIFRPWHEHTGGWFWWGRANCSVDDYKALWTIMRSHFDARGVDNILWAYSPDRCTDSETYLERYPGDEYVDILGADVYHFNGADGTDEYLKSAGHTLDIAIAQARERGKIPALTETGLESLTIADWFTAILHPLLQSHPVAYVVVWRNAHNMPSHFFAPYPGHPSAANFRAFAASPSIIMAP